jgi:hypothetical protein
MVAGVVAAECVAGSEQVGELHPPSATSAIREGQQGHLFLTGALYNKKSRDLSRNASADSAGMAHTLVAST